MHPLRKLRTAMGLSQPDFGQLIGRSYQSIRNYESGIPMPADLQEKLAAIAVQYGHADLAIELRGGTFGVKHVLEPGETLISSGRKRGGNPAASSRDIPSQQPGPGTLLSRTERDRYHAALDEIFDSADPDAIPAVTRNIDVFQKFVRLNTPPGRPGRRRKPA